MTREWWQLSLHQPIRAHYLHYCPIRAPRVCSHWCQTGALTMSHDTPVPGLDTEPFSFFLIKYQNRMRIFLQDSSSFNITVIQPDKSWIKYHEWISLVYDIYWYKSETTHGGLMLWRGLTLINPIWHIFATRQPAADKRGSYLRVQSRLSNYNRIVITSQRRAAWSGLNCPHYAGNLFPGEVVPTRGNHLICYSQISEITRQ